MTEAVRFESANVATYLRDYMETHPAWREEESGEEGDGEDEEDDEEDTEAGEDDDKEEEGEGRQADPESGAKTIFKSGARRS